MVLDGGVISVPIALAVATLIASTAGGVGAGCYMSTGSLTCQSSPPPGFPSKRTAAHRFLSRSARGCTIRDHFVIDPSSETLTFCDRAAWGLRTLSSTNP